MLRPSTVSATSHSSPDPRRLYASRQPFLSEEASMPRPREDFINVISPTLRMGELRVAPQDQLGRLSTS